MNASKRKRNDRGGGAGVGGGNVNRPSSNREPQRPNSKTGNNNDHSHHRFGRVMSQPPKLKLHRGPTSTCHPTVSIAIPGSVVSNAQTRELQTQLAGQIARAAAVFRIDEIVVFDDGLGSKLTTMSNYRRGPTTHRNKDKDDAVGSEKRKADDHQDDEKHNSNEKDVKSQPHMQPSTDPHAFLARILQYCECPQYLRRKFFPMHPDLQFAGLLPPLDAPHHLRRGDTASFREGVVVEQEVSDGGGSFVDCGVPNRLVQ